MLMPSTPQSASLAKHCVRGLPVRWSSVPAAREGCKFSRFVYSLALVQRETQGPSTALVCECAEWGTFFSALNSRKFRSLMKLHINGEEKTFDSGHPFTLAALVDSLGMKPDRVAIELNRDIVPRDLWAQTMLSDGDKLEMVHFVGGGSQPSSSMIARGSKERMKPQGTQGNTEGPQQSPRNFLSH